MHISSLISKSSFRSAKFLLNRRVILVACNNICSRVERIWTHRIDFFGHPWEARSLRRLSPTFLILTNATSQAKKSSSKVPKVYPERPFVRTFLGSETDIIGDEVHAEFDLCITRQPHSVLEVAIGRSKVHANVLKVSVVECRLSGRRSHQHPQDETQTSEVAARTRILS